ncbi:hypothetical protein CRENBAI_005353 [Crenichthys baileyi]|uniref:Uncharacterized protein n=1 Tax=Crenichthys baileyi TaxID=28760 RepID=A0AAV9SNF2_9TELE
MIRKSPSSPEDAPASSSRPSNKGRCILQHTAEFKAKGQTQTAASAVLESCLKGKQREEVMLWVAG